MSGHFLASERVKSAFAGFHNNALSPRTWCVVFIWMVAKALRAARPFSGSGGGGGWREGEEHANRGGVPAGRARDRPWRVRPRNPPRNALSSATTSDASCRANSPSPPMDLPLPSGRRTWRISVLSGTACSAESTRCGTETRELSLLSRFGSFL